MTLMEIMLLALNAVILPLCGWTLYTVHTVAKSLAVEAVYGAGHDREILALRAQMTRFEIDLTNIKIELSKLTPPCHGKA